MSQKFKSELELQALNNATTDTDKFLVSDSGIVKYRTGAEMLSDLGVAPGVASNIQHQVKAGVAINKGQAVYVTSADGTNMVVGLASNASEATSSKTMGLLASTVSINGFANVIAEGLLAGLNTIGATAGDPVWLGTGGNLIYGLINKPYAPAHLVFIGIVTRVNSNNGEIFVKVQNGFELKEIHDVDLITTTPLNGHLLGFNGTLWVNKTIAGWLGYTPADASHTHTFDSLTAKTSGTGTYQTTGEFIQNNGKYVRDSYYRTISGRSDAYSGGSEGWYTVAQVTLTGNCSGSVLYGTLYDHRYNGADSYQIAVVARAECDFESNNQSHYVNVGCTILGSTNYTNYRSKIRVVLTTSTTNNRTYQLQFFETAWNNDAWQLETNGWTIYNSPQTASPEVGTPLVNYVSNQNADYQKANTATYSPIYYDTDDTAYYLNANSTSNLASTYIAGHYYGSYNANNILLKCSSSSASYMGVLGQSSSGAFGFQLFGDGSNYGFLNGNWADWDIRKSINGNLYLNNQNSYYYATDTAYLLRVYGTVDMRSPLYYDNDNTGYYLNPASTSNLYTVNATNYLVTPLIYSGGGSVSFGNDLQLSGNYLRFDESGVRSWNQRASGGNLILNSGDGNGNLIINGNSVLNSSNYTTYTDPRLYRGVNAFTNFQSFVSTPGTVRFDQANATGGFSNAPGGYTYGGVLSLRGDNFGFQLWGSHTGDFYFKTQWQDDQYSGWREVIHSANIGSQSVSYATSAGNADTLDGLHASSFLTSYSETDTLLTVTGRGNTTTTQIGAVNFFDTNVGTYNVNLGSGGSEGRGLVAGYSGGSYGGIGYNVRHTTTGGNWIAPGTDTSTYLLFTAGGFSFLGAAAGTAGRTLSYTTLGNLNSGGLYVPIMYDLNNTGYYLDPSSTSYISSLTVDNTINGNISGLAGSETLSTVTGRGASTSTFSNFNGGLTAAKTSKGTYGIQIKGGYYGAPRLQLYDLAADNNAHLGLGVDMSTNSYEFSNYFPRYAGYGRWSVGSWAGDFGSGQYVSGYNEKLWINESASQFNVQLTSTVDMRAPIFYDSNDTGYYTDPTSTSRLYRLQVIGDWAGSNPNEGAINIRGQYPSMTFRNTASGNMWLRHMDGSGNIQHYFAPSGADANNWSIKHTMFTSGTFFSAADMRSPIFYDSNDTGYYVDPANSSTSAVFNGKITGKHIYRREVASGSNPVKTYEGVLATRSDNGDAHTYYVVETNVAQDSFQMGGFYIDLFNGYSATNQKTTIGIAGYWNPENNGGFIGFEATSTNPNVTPNIQVVRKNSTGNTCFIITLVGDNYPIIVARDLYLGYIANDTSSPDYGDNWVIVGTNDISGYSNNDTIVWNTSPTRTGDNASGTWGINVTGSAGSVDFNNLTNKTGGTGTYTTSGDFRAPIFYDSNDANYYGNFAGQSIFNTLKIGNSGTFNTGTNYALQLSHDNRYLIGLANTSYSTSYYPWIVNDGWNGYESLIFHFNGIGDRFYFNRFGQMQADGDMRSPIFYDSSNTGYYVNPNGSSIFNSGDQYVLRLQHEAAAGDFVDALYVQNNESGGRVQIGMSANGSDGQHHRASLRAYKGSGDLEGTFGIALRQANTTHVQRLTLTSPGDLTVDSSMRAPIFYDSNNTGFYVNPAGSSNVNRVFYNDYLVSQNSGGIMGDYNINGTSDKVIWTIGESWPLANMYGLGYSYGNGYGHHLVIKNNGSVYHRISFASEGAYFTGTVTASGSSRAPIFYDTDNTGYYVDPASGANLYDLTISGASQKYLYINPGNGYEAMVRYNGGSGSGWYVGKRTANQTVNTTDFHFFSEAAGMTVAGIDTGGNIFSTQSVRTGVFYDLDDTSYFVNPASSSKFNNANFTGNCSWFGGYGGGSGPGLGFENQSTFARMAFWGLDFWDWNTGSAMTINNGYVLASGDFRAPIFYDSDNTAYYFDGSSTGDSIRCAGDIVAYYSDERLKDKKGNIENALEKVLSLNGFYYEPNEVAQSLGYKKRLEVGVSAQEVEAVLPEIIKDAPIGGDYKTLDYGKLTPLLIEAVKEQQAQISEQQKQIEELKELVNKLINK